MLTFWERKENSAKNAGAKKYWTSPSSLVDEPKNTPCSEMVRDEVGREVLSRILSWDKYFEDNNPSLVERTSADAKVSKAGL